MTLTQVATITRRAILSAVILVILAVASFVGYQVWYAEYLASLPPQEEKPDVRFGILPLPDFIPSKVSSSNFSYQIATETGGLPDFGKLTKVYFIPKATTTFLAADNAKELARKLNLDTNPEASSESQFKFVEESNSLTINIDTGNFTYVKTNSLAQANQTDSQILINNFRNLLSNLGVLNPDLRDSPAKVTESRIMIWPKNIDNRPIVTAQFDLALIRAEASQSASIIENYSFINFTFWPVDTTTFSTYPLKTAAQALEDLKSGRGIIVIEPKSPQVSITSVYLAYFQAENYSPYLQPVFVFEAPSFVAYVPAITDEFINFATRD